MNISSAPMPPPMAMLYRVVRIMRGPFPVWSQMSQVAHLAR
jgi:hypothetical protein